MTSTSALVAFILFAVVASLNVPGCLPDGDATIVSEAIYQVPDPNTGLETFTNLTLVYFSCVSSQPEESKRQSQTPIDLCGIMESSEVFDSEFPRRPRDLLRVHDPSIHPYPPGTFICTQGPTDLPTLGDCANIDTAVVDSLIRPMTVIIPPLSGLALHLVNSTCALVFLNDDANNTYETCLTSIPDVYMDMVESECLQTQNGFIGSVRSPIEPGVQDWELHAVDSSSLYN
ncbi:hypothetical protein DFH07DRAFT_359440 [Mycena maculata]|uniref:Uncharacterized protein n=1 Tax=Mycena maculata TaxID=230809 RepID=A0AAD7JJA4_9AGAR|nr:hypothetical protein DFH07DRAFT_359440 [Mycena maculata]